jgi:GNAT superfamily N-acetyltransferase
MAVSIQDTIEVRRFMDVQALPGVLSGIDAVFFQSSNTQTFADATARADFRDRWLGHYLTNDPGWAYAAVTSKSMIAGYLVASLDDPALTPRFSDIPYFAAFKVLTRSYPAHLHVNLAPECRGGGIGSALVARFTADAARAGSPGVHVVTSRGARNVSFYARNGFRELGATGDGAREIIFLARDL